MKVWILLAMSFVCSITTAVADDSEDIKATMVAMWAALERGDVDEYGKYVHPDYTVFGESDVYLAKGKALELSGMRDWVARAKDVKTQMHQPQVTVRGDTAWITYYWTDSGTAAGERFSTRGKSTRIFVRDGDGWLCIHGHFTAVP